MPPVTTPPAKSAQRLRRAPRPVDSAKVRPLRPAHDGNGNVRALVKADAANPAASGIVERYAYDGFGRELAGSTPSASSVNTFRFSTKQADAETGMNYYGYRFYAAKDGRWINRDVIEEDGGMNLYSFVENDSIRDIDLWGLISTLNTPPGQWALIETVIAENPGISVKEAIRIASIGLNWSEALKLELEAFAAAEAGAKPFVDALAAAQGSTCPDPCKNNSEFKDVAEDLNNLLKDLWRPLSTDKEVIGDGGAIDAAIWEKANPGKKVGGKLHGQKVRDAYNKLKKLKNRIEQKNGKFPPECQGRFTDLIQSLYDKLADAISKI